MKITNEDNMELMARYEDDYFDYAITDPPYNLNFKYNKYKDDLSEKEYKDWCSKWFLELKRICKKGIFISCGINNLGLWHEIEKPKWVLCWHKPAAMGRSKVGFCNWEPILFYGKVSKQGVDVIKAPIIPDSTMDFHSCPKPVKWAESILYNFCLDGDKIIDIFLGSGSTAIACHNLGYELTGCELDKDYYEAAIKRIEQHKAQKRIF
ncbi:MAG: putative modification methylase [Prokaryotic dsDNA virus sp.]|nr:MAG: putative modification methylase [Prokaryotic dsDNA virus sp.]|tara:strand:+ start:7426 stop:8049 length:624 start_codon:yes stop_codon:yes gene_type:complete